MCPQDLPGQLEPFRVTANMGVRTNALMLNRNRSAMEYYLYMSIVARPETYFGVYCQPTQVDQVPVDEKTGTYGVRTVSPLF